MARPQVQISAIVSRATKELVEKYSRATGVKKGHMVEIALLHYLRALQVIPPEAMIPPRLVVSKKTGSDIAAALESPEKASTAMRELMGGD